MNLFGSTPKPVPQETVDEDLVEIEEMRRQRLMRGRAQTMLSSGGATATASRQVTGN